MTFLAAFVRRLGSPLAIVVLGLVMPIARGQPAGTAIVLGGPVADRMVVQRDMPVPIWGWAGPGDVLTVEFAGQAKTATADGDGKWQVTLDPLPASAIGRDLVVRTETTERVTRVTDVVVGEVWLASGQSNMHWTFAEAHGVVNNEAELSAANDPLNRQFTVVKRGSPQPLERPPGGAWRSASRDNLLVHGVSGDSALCYFFARELRQKLDVPIGIINASFGGSAIEAWTSEEIQQAQPALRELVAEAARQRATFADRTATYQTAMTAWKAEAERARLAGSAPPKQPAPPRNPYYGWPGYYFNGMIAPIVPCALRGVIWYQGEANAATVESAALYRVQLPLLVRDWRSRFNRNLPFAWVQLPNYRSGPGWMLVREAMLQSLAVPDTGMAVTIDIGDAANIHPKNKQEVARRLAIWALGEVYHAHDGVVSGPVPTAHSIDGRRMLVRFKHANGGLRFAGDALRGFEISGADRLWHAADAAIQNECVVVESDDVLEPVAVRYGWASDPDCTLRNAAGLPASPFRTDDWPVSQTNP